MFSSQGSQKVKNFRKLAEWDSHLIKTLRMQLRERVSLLANLWETQHAGRSAIETKDGYHETESSDSDFEVVGALMTVTTSA